MVATFIANNQGGKHFLIINYYNGNENENNVVKKVMMVMKMFTVTHLVYRTLRVEIGINGNGLINILIKN